LVKELKLNEVLFCLYLRRNYQGTEWPKQDSHNMLRIYMQSDRKAVMYNEKLVTLKS